MIKMKSCESCLVYGTDNRPLSRARVEISPDDTIRLFFSNYKLRAVRFKTVVDFYDRQKGLVRTYCELVLRRNPTVTNISEPWIADCDLIDVYEAVQRQKDLRETVRIAINGTTDAGEYFSGTIQNISAGGIFLVTSLPMKVGTKFRFDHVFEGELCEVKAKVLRGKGASGGDFGYGCQFYGLSNEAETAIRKFVFQRQLNRQKQRSQ